MRYILSLFIMLLPLVGTATAQSRLAIEGHLGTTGGGFHTHYKIADSFVVRTGFHYLDYDVGDEDYAGTSYDVSLLMTGASGTIDYHPFRNGFAVSGGMYMSADRSAPLNATEVADYEVGGTVYTAEELGTLTGEVVLAELAPYVGVGWDNTLYTEKKLSVIFRAGVLMSGKPKVSLQSSGGTLSSDPALQSRLDQEEEALEDELEGFQLYPVVNIGFGMRL